MKGIYRSHFARHQVLGTCPRAGCAGCAFPRRASPRAGRPVGVLLAASVVGGLLEAPLWRSDVEDVPPWGEADCRFYQRAVDRRIGADLGALALFVSPLYLQKPEFFYRTFFLGKRSYAAYARTLLHQMTGGLPGALPDAVSFA